jgi:hypothetical protein
VTNMSGTLSWKEQPTQQLLRAPMRIEQSSNCDEVQIDLKTGLNSSRVEF